MRPRSGINARKTAERYLSEYYRVHSAVHSPAMLARVRAGRGRAYEAAAFRADRGLQPRSDKFPSGPGAVSNVRGLAEHGRPSTFAAARPDSVIDSATRGRNFCGSALLRGNFSDARRVGLNAAELESALWEALIWRGDSAGLTLTGTRSEFSRGGSRARSETF